jgi:hypothetical protein
VTWLARSIERHELFTTEPSPSCAPVFDPLRKLRSYRELMARYRLRICG